MSLSKQIKEYSSQPSDYENANVEPCLLRIMNCAAAVGDILSQLKSSGDKSDDESYGTHPSDVLGKLGQDLAIISVEEPVKGGGAWQSGDTKRWMSIDATSWLKSFRREAHTTDSLRSESEASRLESDLTTLHDSHILTDSDEEIFTEEPASISDADLPQADESTSLTSKQKVGLIISEFGPLAREGETEVLLAEADASFIQDVAILGVVHLTTHRITFHASLLNIRPDLAMPRRILHAGAATIRPVGKFRRNQRVWMELTHDMITTYRGSEDQERVRPLRTVLLSALRKIFPFDQRHPRQIRLEYLSKSTKNSRPGFTLKKLSSHSLSRSSSLKSSASRDTDDYEAEEATKDSHGVVSDILEFATEEAALGWRKEIQAALYIYSSRGRAVVKTERDPNIETTADAAAETGVRISVPYRTLQAHRIYCWEGCAVILQLDLGPQVANAVNANESGNFILQTKSCLEHLLTSGPLTHGWDNASQHGDMAKLQFGFLQPQGIWSEFDKIVSRAREGLMGTTLPKPSAVVDFGPLTFVEPGTPVFGAENANGSREVVSGSRERELRRIFGLESELDIWTVRCHLHRTLCTSGLLVISKKFICFWSRFLTSSDIKLRYQADDVRSVSIVRTWCPAHALAVHVRSQPDIQFEFSTSSVRDQAKERLNAIAVLAPPTPRSSRYNSLVQVPDSPDSPPSTHFTSKTVISSNTVPSTPTAILSPLSRTIAQARARTFPPAILAHLAKPINIPEDLAYGITPRHFVCLTIGSRGDVQPYIALGRGLKFAGHRVTLVTHAEYKKWIESYGLTHRTAGGDPGALMKLSVDHKMFSPQFFKESITHFKAWIDELLIQAWEQCKDADVLIESPSAMAGVHIAEALNIPYFRAFTMPWSKTVQYPHPFISPPVSNNKSFNLASYVLFDNIFWLGTSTQINRWRRKDLGLPATDMGHLAQAKIAFLYNFSSSVVPKPLDWADQITITGYWFLDNPDLDWRPSEELLRFIVKARLDGKPLVYIGFGSITVPSPIQVTQNIVKAVLKSGIRAILSKGWSSRMHKEERGELDLPPEVFVVNSAPHDWLFPQMSAVMHHGGAGTTGASLRAGVPTLIKPWFGDQFFWATRVHRLGAGLKVSSLRPNDLAGSLKKATTDKVMREKAAAVGERIRQEDGVSTAIKAIYLYLDRAGKDRRTLR